MMKIESKYIYRFICAIILLAVSTAMFFYVWFRFVSEHNVTHSLLGKGNLGMAVGIYMALYIVVGRLVRAFKIGVERKASVVAAQIIDLFLTDVIEVFLSLAIIGNFRYFWAFTWRYALLWVVQTVVLSIITMLMVEQ